MWGEDLVMLAVGWVSGAVTALLVRRALDKPEPLDPALMPKWEPMPRAHNLEIVPRPDLSEFAPKPKRVWRAPKQQRSTSWTSAPQTAVGKPQPPPPPQPPAQPPTPPPQPPGPVLSPGLLPAIPWGQKHTAAPGG